MSDELVKKALARYVESYPPEEGRTYEQILLVTGVAKVIRDEIDRPKEQKDALMAASLLIASRDVDKHRQLPPDLESYGEHVQTVVQDFVANPKNDYTASADLKQIGLASAITVMPVMAETMKELNLTALRGQPEVNAAIAEMKNALAASKADLEELMTGDQPRLEQRAKDAYESLVGVAREAVRIYETPSGKPASLPKRKKNLGP